MVLSLLKRILMPDSSNDSADTASQAPSSGERSASPEAFVDYVVKALVDNPGEVAVKTVEKERVMTVQVSCERRDIGKVIGKNGKTIGAIRALVNGSTGHGVKKVNVEVLD